MSGYDWQRPQRGLADVPVERDSIGAMGVSGNHTGPVHFYVYRGLGFDVFGPQPPETLPRRDPVVVAEERARRKAQREAKREREQARRDELRRIAWEAERDRRREQIARDLERKREESLRQVEEQAAALFPDPLPEEPDTPKPRVREAPPRPRPSPGWKPMTGGDLEEWLSQLD